MDQRGKAARALTRTIMWDGDIASGTLTYCVYIWVRKSWIFRTVTFFFFENEV